MYELPLFPLRTVLFPGAPLHLHIFEARYKQMIRLCLEEQRPFGVVLIRKGAEALGPLAEPFTVGCTAAIRQVEPLEEDRLNLVAVGHERFRILTLDNAAQPYWVGTVEPFPLAIGDPPAAAAGAVRLRDWVERYVQILAGSGINLVGAGELPAGPLELACLAATILQTGPEQKQELLELETVETLLEGLVAAYRREIPLAQEIVAKAAAARGPFSTN